METQDLVDVRIKCVYKNARIKMKILHERNMQQAFHAMDKQKY